MGLKKKVTKKKVAAKAADDLLGATAPPADEPVITKTREPKVVWVDPPPIEKERPVAQLTLLSDGSAEVLLDTGKMVKLPAAMVKGIAKLVK